MYTFDFRETAHSEDTGQVRIDPQNMGRKRPRDQNIFTRKVKR
uniref:Uncharacterized protein n=1 Tax=Anguilla anguilla TaxID=7936 RepID=A0A0E9WDL2_ANGAN